MPGRKPCVQVAPPSAEVAQPMSEEPPSKKRPLWNAATTVPPYENESGSTWVLCWLVALVNGSELSCTRVAADASTVLTTSVKAARADAAVKRRAGPKADL